MTRRMSFMTRLHRFIDTCIITLIIFLIMFGLYAAYIVVWDNHQSPIEISYLSTDETVKAGGSLNIKMDINRLRQCSVLTEKHFTNFKTKVRYDVMGGTKVIDKVEKVVLDANLSIPIYFEPGPYILQYQFDYYCNPLNYLLGPITVFPEPIYFEVVP